MPDQKPEDTTLRELQRQESSESGHKERLLLEAQAWPIRILAWGAILLASLLIVGLHVRAYRLVSPVDEFTHIDYLFRISHGSILRQGDLLGQEAMREIACRKLDADFRPPRCSPAGRYDPDDFGPIRESGAAQHPPLYYLLTAGVARGIMVISGTDDLVSTGRLVGGLWLALALIVFWESTGRLGIRPLSRAIVIVMLSTTPVVLHASSTVNNDATALLAGSLIMAVVFAWEDSARRIIYLGLAAFLAVLGKGTNIVAVLAGILYLSFRGFARRRGKLPGGNMLFVRGIGTLAIGAISAVIAWVFIHTLLRRAPTSALVEFHRVDSLSMDMIMGQVFSMTTPVINPHLPPFLDSITVLVMVQAVNLVLVAASFGTIFRLGQTDRFVSLGLASAATMAFGGAILTIATFLIAGIFFPIPPRYGLSILPMVGVSLAERMRSGRALVAGGLVAAGSSLVVLYNLIRNP